MSSNTDLGSGSVSGVVGSTSGIADDSVIADSGILEEHNIPVFGTAAVVVSVLDDGVSVAVQDVRGDVVMQAIVGADEIRGETNMAEVSLTDEELQRAVEASEARTGQMVTDIARTMCELRETWKSLFDELQASTVVADSNVGLRLKMLLVGSAIHDHGQALEAFGVY